MEVESLIKKWGIKVHTVTKKLNRRTILISLELTSQITLTGRNLIMVVLKIAVHKY